MAQANTAANNNYRGVSPSQHYILNSSQAQQIIQAAVQEANSISAHFNIAVTDPSGYLIAFLRMDNAFLGSIDISQKKAKTVAMFNGSMTTAQWYDISQPGSSLYGIQETNGGMIMFGGGVPVVMNGIFYGAVGVSGGTAEQDVQVASAGARAVGGHIPSA